MTSSTSRETDLAAQNHVFDVVLSSIADLAYSFDREHRFTYANRPLLDLFGLQFGQVIGRSRRRAAASRRASMPLRAA